MMPGKKPASMAPRRKRRPMKDQVPVTSAVGAGDESPADHDAGNPAPRAEAFEEEVAGHFEQEVADEEDTGAPAVDGGGEAEVAVHVECGETNVHAVDEGD